MSHPERPESWREATARFYRPLASLPDVARRVGWNDDAGQRLRHGGLLANVGDLGAYGSVLDAGCGEATMLDALRERGFSGAYRGEELLDEVAARGAARVAADPKAEVVVGDLFGAGPAADLVLCSGALNVAPRGAGPAAFDAWAEQALDALWSRARVALAFDVAVRGRHHADRDAPDDAPRDIATHDVGRLAALARERATAVAVREDIVPGEATLVLWRRREPMLRSLLPGDEHAVARARILLREGDIDGALSTLPPDAADRQVTLWRAVASLARSPREAETSLRAIAAGPPGDAVADEARVHLASWLARSGRSRACRALLEAMVQHPDTAALSADHARWLLIERFAHEPSRRERLIADITDAGIRRIFER